MRNIFDAMRGLMLDIFNPSEPQFTARDYVRSAQYGKRHRKDRTATKDRSKIKAARKQRNKGR